jgi:transcriptional regulator with XRE-family HTH domain
LFATPLVAGPKLATPKLPHQAAWAGPPSQALEALMPEPWDTQREALGAFIRTQRKLANLSLRQLAEMTSLSNPYLSQVERGLHQPSVRVLKLISDALNVSAETLLAQAGLLDGDRAGAAAAAGQGSTSAPGADAESAILADQRLTDEQKNALITVYRSMLRSE